MQLRQKLYLSLLILTALTTPSLAQQVVITDAPLFEEEEATIRVRITDKNKRPIMNLQERNFQIFVDNEPVKLTNWKSPELATPPPAYIIVLLDLSGSMGSLDSGGKTKLDGAISAIQELTKITAKRGENTQISIVPFGEGDEKCPGYTVNNDSLNNFFTADSQELQIQLNELKKIPVCASTNLYDPLTKAIRFLGNKDDSRFYPPQNSFKKPPRLSIILLSDGYHNHPDEQEHFENLTVLLNTYDEVIVHTLGYGLTPQELAKKYQLSEPVTRNDVNQKKIPQEEFIDQDRLEQIANLTGGIAEFSGNSEDIAANLGLFLNALLGEYEISYTEPNPERGAQHQVKVKVNILDDKFAITSEIKDYTVPVFGRSLPLQIRLIMISCIILILVLGGVLPFYFWGKYLKDKA
jgi:VWFA-related protein